MWIAWFIVGFLLLVTKRYAKKFAELVHILHALLGYFVLIVTIVFSMKVTKWDPTANPHTFLGTVSLFLTMLGSLSGIVTAIIGRAYTGDKDWAKKELMQKTGKVHRIAGYIMLFVCNVTVASGLFNYYHDINPSDGGELLARLCILAFIVLVAGAETIYRVRNRYSLGHIKTPEPSETGKVQEYTIERLDKEVSEGRDLVIFDNLVIDIDGYAKIHPGGKFNINHNLGRDISKFFFGGYQLVNVKGIQP